jgi:gliding motility associated protien GldN
MKNIQYFILFNFLLLCLNFENLKAEPEIGVYAGDVNQIDNPAILFSKRIWREINLKENANKPYFFNGKEISKIIINGVLSGNLTAYSDETLNDKLSLEDFKKRLMLPQLAASTSVEDEEEGWGNDASSSKTNQIEQVNYFLPNEVSLLEIMEDKIFSKETSSWTIDIRTVKLIIPAYKFTTGLRREVATFSYKELANYFDSIPKEALWRNPKNDAANIKLSDSFKMRLFHSTIVKISNPDNANLEDIYNKYPQEKFIVANQLEEKLIEWEYDVWEK